MNFDEMRNQEQQVWSRYMKALNKKLSYKEGTNEFKLYAKYADVLLKQYRLLIKTNLIIAAEHFHF